MTARAAFIGIGISIALLAIVFLAVTAMMPTVLAIFTDGDGAIILSLLPVIIAAPFVYRRIRDYGFFNPTLEKK